MSARRSQKSSAYLRNVLNSFLSSSGFLRTRSLTSAVRSLEPTIFCIT
jgi:hypothetical protein